jgi:hypothetical protein
MAGDQRRRALVIDNKEKEEAHHEKDPDFPRHPGSIG